MDRFTKEQRSSLMSKVRVRNTDIEKILGDTIKQFWKIERYRKNVRNLPGKPDIFFPKSKLVIFADGDFWHGKDFKKWESKIPSFWRKKIAANIRRDRIQTKILKKGGYRVLRFYGSKIKRNPQFVEKKIRTMLNC